MTDLLRTVTAWLGELLPPGSRVLVATSGGPDSQCLLDLIGRSWQQLGLDAVFALGVDHGLRVEAKAELDFAEALASRHGIPFARSHVNVPVSGNLLAQARRVRYRALRRYADQTGADRIAVAHTATDQAETVLMHLARGSGLRGAGGIPRRRGAVVRPLLDVPRHAIAAYLSDRQIPFASDPSNADPRRARARLRAGTLPALRDLNRNFDTHVASFARRAQADEAFLRSLASKTLHASAGPLGSLCLCRLRRLPEPLAWRVLRLWLERHGLRSSGEGVERLLRGCKAEQFGLSLGGQHFRVEAGHLWSMAPEEPYERAIALPGETEVPRLGVRLRARLLSSAEVLQRDPLRHRGEGHVAFDGDRLHLELKVRSWCRGDWVRPFGLNGRIKIGDLFTNEKVPRPLRRAWPIVVHGDDVVWVVGLRRGSLAPVEETTRRVVAVEVAKAFPQHACYAKRQSAMGHPLLRSYRAPIT